MKTCSKIIVIIVAMMFASSLLIAGCSKKTKPAETAPSPPPNQTLPTPSPEPNQKYPSSIPNNQYPNPPANQKYPAPPNQQYPNPPANQQYPAPPPNQKLSGQPEQVAAVTPSPVNNQTPPGPAPAGTKGLFEKRCSKCHELDRIYKRQDTPQGWTTVVERMKLKMFSGISDQEAVAIANYLAAAQGK